MNKIGVVFGGAGYVGSAAIQRMVKTFNEIYSVNRSRKINIKDEKVREIHGDCLSLRSNDNITDAIDKCDSILHTVGILFESSPMTV